MKNILNLTHPLIANIMFYFLMFVFLPNQSTAQNVFTKMNRRPTNLSNEMGNKLTKFEKDTNNFKKCHYVKVGDIRLLQTNNRLTIHIPSTGKPIVFKSKRVETYSDENYTWYGESEDELCSITLQNKGGLIFGFIKNDGEVSEIYGLTRGESVVLDKKPITRVWCPSEPEIRVTPTPVPRNNVALRTACDGPPIINSMFKFLGHFTPINCLNFKKKLHRRESIL